MSNSIHPDESTETSCETALHTHLSVHEADVLNRQVHVPSPQAGIRAILRYATPWDFFVITISSVSAIAGGAALPLMSVIFGQISGTFRDRFSGAIAPEELHHRLADVVLYFVYLAIGEFFAVYIYTVGFIYAGERITNNIRAQFLRACLRQNVAFYDNMGAGEITTRITADTNLIQDAISEKIGLTMSALATFIIAFIIGFIKNWKLTLILSCIAIAIIGIMGGASRWIVKYAIASLSSYALGGSLAEEVFSSVRNSTAFGTQNILAVKYDKHLIEAERFGFKMKLTSGIMVGLMLWVMYLGYALAFWQGTRFVVSGETNGSAVVTILLAIMIASFSVGNVSHNIQAFTSGLSAAAKIFQTIDRVSPIDPCLETGQIPSRIQGLIELRNIHMKYPSRSESLVLDDVSLTIPAGKTTAIVGSSGSGKSTIVNLIERFYEPLQGVILLDGLDISGLNLQWLRKQMSLVSQEPTLFRTTIYENIAYGLIGTSYEQEAPEKIKERVIEAAKSANAHSFITSLPESYDTDVGDRGYLLSGGQKQRIAIARAIISNPQVLLLDEATSALDRRSESIVQDALDAVSAGRTTITIAHRLSTIRDADNIVVMADGRISEQGTHSQLLGQKGLYHRLVEAQVIMDKAPGVQKQADHQVFGDEKTEFEQESQHVFEKVLVDGKRESGNLKPRNAQPPDAEDYSLWSLIMTIARLNLNEKYWMIFGLLCSVVCGAANPTSAVFFARSIVNMSGFTGSDGGQFTHRGNFWSLMYLMLAFTQLIGYMAEGVAFAYCSERLVHRVRAKAFRSILRQDISYFDHHSAGALASFLSTDTTEVSGLSGITLGSLLNVSTTLVAGVALSIAIGWKLALATSATIPLLLLCGFWRFHVLAEFERRSKVAYEASASYACEATSSIRTVASLTREVRVLQQYQADLYAQSAKSLRHVLRSSTLYAISQSVTFLAMALAFWYGGTLFADQEYSLLQFYICYSAIIFGAQSAGTIFSFAPDMGKAKEAARQLRVLFDRRPSIDTWSTTGEQVSSVQGHVEFRDCSFRYPRRAEIPVLKNLNLSINPGQFVALVGASGSGKSTIISLLERFYDPISGSVRVDGMDISSLNVNNYRSFLGLVSQEPTLYQGTVRENILFGIHENPHEVSEARIELACKEANIHDFIMSLPQGLETLVGSRGSLLSGGQKQRIAIARALIRNPRILLLDEATSALDAESEGVVQAALDQASKGRTTIAVAHRISSIQHADVIYVLEGGMVVEQGTHEELMGRKGKYADLAGLI